MPTLLRDTIIPKSDQLNTDDLLAGGRVITVTSVKKVAGEQPVAIHYEGDNGRPYKPCLSMRKILIYAWGEDGDDWIGRTISLYCDTAVMFGVQRVGGIRIDGLSHIENDLEVSITIKRGRKALVRVSRIDSGPGPVEYDYTALTVSLERSTTGGLDGLKKAWIAIPTEAKPKLEAVKEKLKQQILNAAKQTKPDSDEMEDM